MNGLEKLLASLANVRKAGDGKWEARCPAHEDDRASLSVTRASDRVVLVHCHAGCGTDKILEAVGLKLADLFPSQHERNGHAATIVATYDYRDTDGTLIFQAVRLEPKSFRQRRPKEGGGWTWAVKGCKVVPYRLPELSAADASLPVFVVEGEKDADRLASLGLVTTCNAGGAGKWRSAHAKFLAGRRVVILPDNDPPGRDHAAKVAKSLDGVAASIKVVELPGLPDKGDVSDWLDAGGTVEELRKLVDEAAEWTPGQTESPAKRSRRTNSKLPDVELPGGERSITAAAADFAALLAAQRIYFLRGGVPTRIGHDDTDAPVLLPVKASEFASDVERVAQPVRVQETKEGSSSMPANCSRAAADVMLAAESFRSKLPVLRVLSRCPVLVERGGSLVEVVGFDLESGVLAKGQWPDSVSLDEARTILGDVLADFRFASPSDRSRALAAMITPALVFGGLLPGRAPVDLGEADESQSGKGYRNRVTAAIYRHHVVAINQTTSAIGGLEESFDRALIAGQTFIAFDNIRGKVDSPKVESFLTEDTYYARCAYMPNTEINPHRVYVMFTSNKADVTTDLANRCSCVRILKQPAEYQYRKFAEGDLLSHVRLNQPRFLGAVFAIVRAWYAKGKPRTDESRHDFRAWAQVLDWIVQNLLGEAPLMDGHRETQRRMTTPAMNWLREVMLAAVRQGKADQWLIAAHLIDVMDTAGIDVPGLADGHLDDEATCRQVWQQTGRKLKRCFGEEASIALDGYTIERSAFVDDERHSRVKYRVKIASAADTAADPPLMLPLMISRVAADAADTYVEKRTRARTHAPAHAHAHGPPLENISGISGFPGFINGAHQRHDDNGCPKCGHPEFVDVPIHNGRSIRRDCARCGHTMGFPEWAS